MSLTSQEHLKNVALVGSFNGAMVVSIKSVPKKEHSAFDMTRVIIMLCLMGVFLNILLDTRAGLVVLLVM